MDHILGILGTLRHLITCQMSPTRLINQHHGVELIVFIIIIPCHIIFHCSLLGFDLKGVPGKPEGGTEQRRVVR